MLQPPGPTLSPLASQGQGTVSTSQCQPSSQPWHVAVEASARGCVSASSGMLAPGCSVAFQAVTLFIGHINWIAVSVLHLLLFLCVTVVTQLSKGMAELLEGLM